MSKPKVLWIKKGSYETEGKFEKFYSVISDEQFETGTPVVEKLAYDALKTERDLWVKNCSNMTDICDNLKHDLDLAKKDQASLRDYQDSLVNERDDLSYEVERLQEENSRLKESIKRSRQSQTEDIRMLQAENERLIQDLNELGFRSDRYAGPTYIECLEKTIKTLESDFIKANDEIAKHQLISRELEEKLESVKGDSDAHDWYESYRVKIKDLETQIEDYKSKLTKLVFAIDEEYRYRGIALVVVFNALTEARAILPKEKLET